MAGFFNSISRKMAKAENTPPPRQYVEKGGKWLVEVTKLSLGESNKPGREDTEWTAMEFKIRETIQPPNIDLDGPDYAPGTELNWHKYLDKKRNVTEMLQLGCALTQESFEAIQNGPKIMEAVYADEGAAVKGTLLVMTSSRNPSEKYNKVFYNTSFEHHADPA